MNNTEKGNGKKMIIIIVVVVAIFVASINLLPSFAYKLEKIPVVGTLVNVLQFNKGESEGGEITDGLNVSLLELKKGNDFDIIKINFDGYEKDSSTGEIAPHYDIKYENGPSTMTFEISGVRNFEAKEYFDDILKSDYVKDIYQIMTLDDSAYRFAIVFNEPINFEVEEYKNPAYVSIKVEKDEDFDQEQIVYSIRTNSEEFGEKFAIIEESFFDIKDVRILKDDKNEYFYEIEQFNDKITADDKLDEYKTVLGDEVYIFVEEREINEQPKNSK